MQLICDRTYLRSYINDLQTARWDLSRLCSQLEDAIRIVGPAESLELCALVVRVEKIRSNLQVISDILEQYADMTVRQRRILESALPDHLPNL